MQGKPCAVDFALSSLTTFRWRFAFANPLVQPSASSGFRLPESQGILADSLPCKGAALLVRSARGRYQPRTAPRLLTAERQVASRQAGATTRCTASAASYGCAPEAAATGVIVFMRKGTPRKRSPSDDGAVATAQTCEGPLQALPDRQRHWIEPPDQRKLIDA